MKKYFVIDDLCDGTLVKADGEYGIVRNQRSIKPYYEYIGYESSALISGFSDRELADAVKVLDFPTDEDE